MALVATAKICDEMVRLVWRSGVSAAIDLKLRYAEVHGWFAGVPVYRTMPAPTYPPATYPLLWPFLGWMSVDVARWLWAATTVVALAWMTRIIVRESRATGAWERAFAALLLLAMNQTGVAIGNGQLILHILPVLVTGLLLIQRGSGAWAEDVAAAACIIFAMMKVTLAVPFLWLVLFAPALGREDRAWPWRLRPTMLVAVGYGALTIFAAAFQRESLGQQLREFAEVARVVSSRGGDYANLSAWLGGVGLPQLVPAASAAVFLALGAWLYWNRQVDVWVRLGVVAIVTRFLTYHRLYDDVLVVLALVALMQSKSARVLIGVTVLFMLLPARMGVGPSPWREVFILGHTLTWLAMLAYLTASRQLRGRHNAD